MDHASYTGNLTDQFHGEDVCTGGHDMMSLIARRFFNCVVKNLAKGFNNKTNEQLGQSGNSSVKKRKTLQHFITSEGNCIICEAGLS